MKGRDRLISSEALILLALCLFDMFTSAWLFQNSLAIEANPVLRPAAEAGIFPFLSVKMLTFAPALAIAEWYRRRRPGFVLPLLRWAAALYVGIYLILVLRQFV